MIQVLCLKFHQLIIDDSVRIACNGVTLLNVFGEVAPFCYMSNVYYLGGGVE